MANPTQNVNSAPTPAVAAPANGAQPTAVPAKRVSKPREVPVIGVSPSKAEHDEIHAALDKFVADATASMGGIKLDVAVGPFVLACALKTIRSAKK